MHNEALRQSKATRARRGLKEKISVRRKAVKMESSGLEGEEVEVGRRKNGL